jgi:uncharacterized protein YndB with AHSA1/START domain
MAEISSRTTTELPASTEEVWEALTSPAGVEDWLGDGSELTPVEGSDLDVADVETGVRKRGRVDEVEDGRRLGYVWWPADGGDGDAAATRVTIELVPHEGGTTLVVTERPWPIATGTATATASVAVAPRGTWAWRFSTVEPALGRRPGVIAAARAVARIG